MLKIVRNKRLCVNPTGGGGGVGVQWRLTGQILATNSAGLCCSGTTFLEILYASELYTYFKFFYFIICFWIVYFKYSRLTVYASELYILSILESYIYFWIVYFKYFRLIYFWIVYFKYFRIIYFWIFFSILDLYASDLYMLSILESYMYFWIVYFKFV